MKSFVQNAALELEKNIMRNWLIRDHTDDTLLEAIEKNIIGHNLYFASKHPQMKVLKKDHFILVDTETKSEGYNYVFMTKSDKELQNEDILQPLDYIKKNNRPFTWLIGPTILDEDAKNALSKFGLKKVQDSFCMLINLSHFRKRLSYIRGFHVQQVLSKAGIDEFLKVLKNSGKTSKFIDEYFSKLGSLNLNVSDPVKLYVGYLNNKPAIVGDLYLGNGIAGISTCISSEFEAEKRDLTVDLTSKMLCQAKHQGYHYSVVKALKEQCYFYHQLGFKPYCQFYQYQ